MSETKTVTLKVGPGLLSMLGVAFIVLKLTGYINWSWWLVLLPIYGPVALGLAFFAVVLMLAGLAVWLD